MVSVSDIEVSAPDTHSHNLSNMSCRPCNSNSRLARASLRDPFEREGGGGGEREEGRERGKEGEGGREGEGERERERERERKREREVKRKGGREGGREGGRIIMYMNYQRCRLKSIHNHFASRKYLA